MHWSLCMKFLYQQMRPDARAKQTLGKKLGRLWRNHGAWTLALASAAIPISTDNPTVNDRFDFKLLTAFSIAETFEGPSTPVASLRIFGQVNWLRTNGQVRVVSTFRGRSTLLLSAFVFLRRWMGVFESTGTIDIPFFFGAPTKVLRLQ